MRLSRRVLATAVCVGVLWSGLTASTRQAGERCAAANAALEAARTAFQEATKATLKLYDQVAVREELIAVQVRLLNLASAAEQQARNEWQAAIDRYMACASKPRNNACPGEKKAMDDATDRLNARLAERRKAEAELSASFDGLADLRKALDDARDAWADALKALQKAQAAVAGCRPRARVND